MLCAAGAGWTLGLVLLHEKGASLDAPDRFGRTPMHHVAESGSAEAVAWLLRAGVNFRVLTVAAGKTPWDMARELERDDIQELLWQAGSVAVAPPKPPTP